VIDHVHLPTVVSEVKLLNRSPLAAGAMYRRTAWEKIGGYNESLDYQEDYDFWIRFINKFDVANVNLPLMYYRQHDSNMSDNLSGRLESRREVKSEFVETHLTETRVDRGPGNYSGQRRTPGRPLGGQYRSGSAACAPGCRRPATPPAYGRTVAGSRPARQSYPLDRQRGDRRARRRDGCRNHHAPAGVG